MEKFIQQCGVLKKLHCLVGIGIQMGKYDEEMYCFEMMDVLF